MARTTITESDDGKRVVNADGEVVGLVSGVRDGTAYVDPDPGIAERVTARLGWDDVDDEDYPLEPSKIETITDEEIRLKREL